jgi:hypothetical protein
VPVRKDPVQEDGAGLPATAGSINRVT